MRSVRLSAVFVLGGLLALGSAFAAQEKGAGAGRREKSEKKEAPAAAAAQENEAKGGQASQPAVPPLQQMVNESKLTDQQKEQVNLILQEHRDKCKKILDDTAQTRLKKQQHCKFLEEAFQAEELRELGVDGTVASLPEPELLDARETIRANQNELRGQLKKALSPEQWDRLTRLRAPDQDLIVNSLGMKFKRIPAGSFKMGSEAQEGGSVEWWTAREDERPVRKVMFTKPLYIGVYEVTQGQFEKIMGRNPSIYQGDAYPVWAGLKLPADYRDEYRPVENVSWYDAQEFCLRLSVQEGVWYRLPTEAEWEYACRAGTTTKWYWGNEDKPEYCDFSKDIKTRNEKSVTLTHKKIMQTAEVGTRKPNAWGLYDMMGNVAEWCEDAYGPYPAGDQVDPEPATNGVSRVKRGGAWSAWWTHTSSSRQAQPPSAAGPTIGFRVVRSVE